MPKYLDILLSFVMTLTLAVAMLWPMEQPPQTPEGSDKLVHFIAFAALVLPLAITRRISLLSVFLGACAFGGAIELIQPIFNRSNDIKDWVMDVIGVIFGIGCSVVYRSLHHN